MSSILFLDTVFIILKNKLVYSYIMFFVLYKDLLIVRVFSFFIYTYVTIKFSSRLNHSESTSIRDNSHLYLHPSGGAIPKQKNLKSNNNRRVINNCKLFNV